MKEPQLTSAALLLAAALLLLPGVAHANVGPPSTGGQIAGEPLGVVDIAIRSETLTIDLRPLVEGKLANVQAIYFLHNTGAAKTLDLVFASGSAGTTNFRIWLGDKPIQGTAAKGEKLPNSWQVPMDTPGISNGVESGLLGYHPGEATPRTFSVTIPPGHHELKVQYSAELARNQLGTPNVFHQFAYVLAPARAWSSFGGLDVTVQVPENWRAACRPTLTRDGNSLTGHFDDVPADALTLTVQASEGWVYWLLNYTSIALFYVSLVGGIAMCWKEGRSAGRSLVQTRSRSLGVGLLWGLTVFGTGTLAIFGPEQALPVGQVSNYGYDRIFMMLGLSLLSVLLVPVGFLIAYASGANPHQGEAK